MRNYPWMTTWVRWAFWFQTETLFQRKTKWRGRSPWDKMWEGFRHGSAAKLISLPFFLSFPPKTFYRLARLRSSLPQADPPLQKSFFTFYLLFKFFLSFFLYQYKQITYEISNTFIVRTIFGFGYYFCGNEISIHFVYCSIWTFGIFSLHG